MATKTRLANEIDEGTEFHDFEILDSKGRKLGASVRYSVRVFEPVADDARTCYTIPAGTYFCWYGHATRNGERFGALQSTHRCDTEAERFEQVQKYLDSARKRAQKNAA